MTEVYLNNREARRFELAIDGDVAAWVDYELGLGTIALNHTEVLPAFRGRGLAGAIVAFALAHAQIGGLHVVARCSFVASFIERNSHEVSLTGIPRMGRATVIGALIGALSIAVPVAAFLLYLSADAMSILAGVHVGFFGGMGFGGMLGAVIQADRHERTQGADYDRSGYSLSGARRGILCVHT